MDKKLSFKDQLKANNQVFKDKMQTNNKQFKAGIRGIKNQTTDPATKTKWYKKKWVWAVIIVALALSLGKNSDTKTAGSTVVNKAATTQTKSSGQKQVQPAATPAKTLTVQDKLWQAVDVGLKSRKGINISYDTNDPTDRVAFIEHTDASPFDAQSFIRQSFTILVLFGQEAFKIDGVDSVNVQNKTDFTDQYGNKKLDNGVVIDMHKADFVKFNWDNLKYQPISNQIQAASDVYIINSALQPYTDAQLYLSLSYNP